jgi:hypothetical protein
MAVVMRMEWPGVTPEQYEAARKVVHWENDVPEGAIFHVAFFDEGGFKVLDVWESEEDFNAFAQSRLMPSLEPLGFEGEPKVTFTPAQAYFNAQALATA